jgi:hypothetical protein
MGSCCCGEDDEEKQASIQPGFRSSVRQPGFRSSVQISSVTPHRFHREWRQPEPPELSPAEIDAAVEFFSWRRQAAQAGESGEENLEYYYYNLVTDETTWSKPKSLVMSEEKLGEMRSGIHCQKFGSCFENGELSS